MKRVGTDCLALELQTVWARRGARVWEMSATTPEPASPTPTPSVGEPFVEFCQRYLAQLPADTQRILQVPPPLDDAAENRRQWLSAMSTCLEGYLRSPAFLLGMQRLLLRLLETPDLAVAEATPAPNAAYNSNAVSHPLMGLLAAQQSQAAETMASWQRYLGIDPTQFPPESTPSEVVFEEGTLRLLRYRSKHAVNYVQPILLCFSLVNRPSVLDLTPARSVVRQFLARGFDVFLIDWGVPTEDDHDLRIYDYVCGMMQNVVNVVCKLSHSPQVNLLGYCMGGTLATIFTALSPAQVSSLTLLAAPIDFSRPEGLLNLWSRPEYFNVDQVVDRLGNCPGSLLQACFQLTRPVQNFVEKYLNLFERRHEIGFLENFFALERWAADSIPVAGETFREFVKDFYQRNLLAQGKLALRGRTVDLRQISCPLLLLTAEHDHLVPPFATLAIHDMVNSSLVNTISLKSGHIGLAIGATAHDHFWPEVTRWIAERSIIISQCRGRHL